MTLSWDELEQIQGRQAWRIPVPPTCPNCDYILTGLTSSRCPQCGQAFHWTAVRKRAGQIWSLINTMTHANRDAMVGLKAAGFGWLIMAPMLLLKLGWATCFLRSLAGAAGLVGIVLGGQVFSIRRIPVWAREYMAGDPPNVLMGAGAALLGLSVVFVGLFIWKP